MTYERIAPLPDGFVDGEAISVESLKDAWVEQRSGLAESGALGAFNDRLERRWAIETGIIERLYSLDRGTTEILVSQGLDATLIEHGASDLPAAELITILKDHREAAAYVIDYVRSEHGITPHFIRSVHSLLTRNQDQVEAEDQFGRLIRTPLRHGEWKSIPNNPRRPDGVVHDYCPPVIVEEEIESLLNGYQRMLSQSVPTVIRAAWLHHRFAQIHPFQDGNGRVARALTAFVFVKDNCFPIVVDRDVRGQYIEALEKADDGDLRPLVRLFARLEKRELEEALSLAEGAMALSPTSPEIPLRAKLLAAFRDRARDKRLAITARRRSVIEKGLKIFRDHVVGSVQDLGEELNSILLEELPGSNVRVERSTPETRHYFKAQIVRVAQREGYYCDLATVHEWVRLRLQRPGEVDSMVSELVVSLHSLGRQFTGVLVLAAYFATRFIDENDRSVTLEPHQLAERSLTFSYLEDEANVVGRTEEWLTAALDIGLEHIRSSL
jgi:Fic family protein